MLTYKTPFASVIRLLVNSVPQLYNGNVAGLLLRLIVLISVDI